MNKNALLETNNLSIRFGGLVAVDSVNLSLNEGKIWALIGPNGAGKSTLLNLITGIYKPTEGEIYFGGKNTSGKKTSTIAADGIGRTFQSIMLFRDLTVLENVMTGYTCRMKGGMLGAILNTGIYRKSENKAREVAEEMLRFLGLEEKKHLRAGQLPYGEQRLLEIARALATRPKLLLLDEPAAGMNPTETEVLMQKIKEMNQSGVTILVIEHNMNFIMNIADEIVVLEFGKKIAQGTPREIKNNPLVIEAYLGGDDDVDFE